MNHFSIPTKSVSEIIRTNTLTFFNALNFFLAAAVFLTGEYKNLLFMGVVIANMLIGIFQEIRAKLVIDRLSLLHQAKIKLLQNNEITETDAFNLAVNNVIILEEGGQIPADCEIISGEIEANESLLTGESEPVFKKSGDFLFAGSFVICGSAQAIVRRVGEENFAYSIIKGAKYLKKNNSEMLRAINKIVKWLAVIIIPVGIILTVKSVFFTGESVNIAVNSSVAAIIGMIPQGLILLTSLVMAISVIRLSRQGALARDMYCAETLARVDMLCLDKTGTLTTGEMTVEEVKPLNGGDMREIEDALCALMQVLPDKNPTAMAIRNYSRGCPMWHPVKIYPFSSARKYSGATFVGRDALGTPTTYTLGAAELFRRCDVDIFQRCAEGVAPYDGKRVLTLAKNNQPIAHIIINDKIRPEARETLEFFDRQGVEIKIISGDNPLTVKSAAEAAGVKNADNYIDMSGARSENISEIAKKYTIFGRVTPNQKLEIIKALKSNYTVGMVGDGVNDVLSLKEADCGIAMKSGSEAARNVASLVLLDNNFAALPKAVAEGRRSINNLERSAGLFLTRTVYSLILAVIFLFSVSLYPFIPIQLTLINAVFIGIPSFLLALEKNENLVRGKFINNVLSKAVPYGLFAALAVGFTTLFAGLSATVILGLVSFAILCSICRPLNKRRFALVSASGLLFALALNYLDSLLFST